MTVYVVTWNINKAGAQYNTARDAFLIHLGKIENTADPNLETVRFVSTSSSARQVSEYLWQKLDGNDRLFVSQLIRENYYGRLTQAVWDWIDARL